MSGNPENPPCILDPSKDCNCSLRHLTAKNVQIKAIVQHTDFPTAAQKIRDEYEKMTAFEQAGYLMDQISALSKMGLLGNCKDYTDTTTE